MPKRTASRAWQSGAWARIVIGLLLMAVPVAVFIGSSERQNKLLDGDRHQAVVVRTVPDAGWNIFDFGRIIVDYDVDGRSHRESIWLDDHRNLVVGDTIEVLVDPADPTRVRTSTDQNTPNGIGTWLLLLGLLGFALTVAGARQLNDRRVDTRLAKALPGHGFGPPRTTDEQSVVHEVAWDEPAIRTAWRRHLRIAGLQLVGASVVAGFMAFLFVQVDHRDAEFLREGRRTSATVTGSDYGGRHSVDRIYVTYEVDGKPLDGTLNNEFPDDHPKGSTLTVVYDPDDPHDFRSLTNPNHSGAQDTVLFGISLVTGLVGAAGILGGLAAVRWRRWLRSHATRPAVVREGALPRFLQEDAYILRIEASDPPPLDVATRLTGVRRWLDAVPFLGGPPGDLEGPVRVCAGTRRRMVVFDPDVQVPVEVVLPRSVRSARRWLAHS